VADDRAVFVRPGLHHLALTVTDLEVSIAWYEAVFSISYRWKHPIPAASAGCSPTTTGR
jgi:catechol 2,3-dioxygenase-like lactoylglutathione lyase family enzyme